MRRIAIVSDIHYAGPLEQRHGADFELAAAQPSLAKALVALYRHYLWMRNPLAHNGLLDRFIKQASQADLVIATGDYTCDVAGVGVSNDEANESVQLCLGKLRGAFGDRCHAIMGDHELGKVSLLGDHGGLRLQSWHRAVAECGLAPFWQIKINRFVLLGITSTLVALPAFQPDARPDEWAAWETLRAGHLAAIRTAFDSLQSNERVLLFCHDPTALPFLWQEDVVRAHAGQIAGTFIGHLHTRLVLWKSRLLAGIPPVNGLGVSVHRMTTALNRARHWRPFHVHLCPSLAGIELFKAGGFLTVDLEESGQRALRVTRHRMPRIPVAP